MYYIIDFYLVDPRKPYKTYDGNYYTNHEHQTGIQKYEEKYSRKYPYKYYRPYKFYNGNDYTYIRRQQSIQQFEERPSFVKLVIDGMLVYIII